MMTTGDRIRQARMAKGMTQEELAAKLGVKFGVISKYETGRVKNLKRETIAALAEILDVKPSWLMCMDDGNMELRGEIREELRILNDLAKDAPKSVILEAAALIQRYKEQNNDPDT